MAERFFVDAPITGSEARLEGPEAHHLVRVMRAKVGDDVVLFDGSDAEFPARVTHIGRSAVTLQVGPPQRASREASRRMILGVALPKGDRQRWLVEKAVELGVAEMVPLVTARGVVQARDGTRRRLARTIVEASKQCGRNTLMRLAEPTRLEDFLRSSPPEALRWIAHPCPDAQGVTSPPRFGPPPTAGRSFVAVGPEGGFTEEEMATAQAHAWRVVFLGPRVLRVETAALALASLMLLGD